MQKSMKKIPLMFCRGNQGVANSWAGLQKNVINFKFKHPLFQMQLIATVHQVISVLSEITQHYIVQYIYCAFIYL